MSCNSFGKVVVQNKNDSSYVLEGFIVDRGTHKFSLDVEVYNEYTDNFDDIVYELSWNKWKIIKHY